MIYSRKAIRWKEMSDTFRHGSEQIIYVLVTLFKV